MGGYIAAWVVRQLWQRWLGPKYNNRKNILCRFEPTCSTYAIAAFKKYGFLKGLLMTVNRLKRCNNRNTDSCIDFP